MDATTLPMLTELRCAEAPMPGGHCAQGVLHGDVLHVSGQLGVARDLPAPDAMPVAAQVAFALGNVERIARVVGAGRTDVVRCTVFVAGLEHWEEMDQAFAAFIGVHRPARSVVPCGLLPYGAKVAVDAIVVVGR